MTAPSQSPEMVRIYNARNAEKNREWRRAKPSHPCHRYPDEVIINACQRCLAESILKGTVNRQDIYIEIILPDGKSQFGTRPLDAGDKRYVKKSITAYMDKLYPVALVTRRNRWWDISRTLGGEPLPRDYSEMSDDQIEARLREIREIKYQNSKQIRYLTIEEIELREEMVKRKTPMCCGIAMVRISLHEGGSFDTWMCRKCGGTRQA